MTNWRSEGETDLCPLPVAAEHLGGGDAGEECVGGQVVGQSREELGHVDEVHLQQNVLEQP